MNKMLDYFIPKGELSLYERQKSIAFVVIAFVGFSLTLINIIQSVVFPTQNWLVTISSALFVNLFVVISLFLLKKHGLKIAGNIFAFGLVVLLAISMNVFNKQISIAYKFYQGFYNILALLVFSVLIASWKD